MDVLSEVLATLNLESQLYFRAELSAPFSIRVPDEPGVIRFHIVAEGSCTIALPDLEPVALQGGDLILVPHGSPHVLSDPPGRPAMELSAVLASTRFDGVGPLVHGGSGRKSVFVCGHFVFEDTPLHPILSSLPRLMHVRSDDAERYGWMEQMLRHIEHEARTDRAGHLEITRRLSEILLIEVLRAYVDQADDSALSALADAQLGRVLRAVHSEPQAAWSLEDLARIAGQSRTVFAERFRARMGVPPMRYIASWRMQKARSLLARAGASVSDVARRVGYSSESAFSRNFREEFGTPPGVYRRTRGAA